MTRSRPLGILAGVVLANSFGNLLLRIGMQEVGPTISLSPWPYIAALLNPFVLAGVFILTSWLVLQLSLLSRADLSYVLPVTALSYICAGLLGAFLLGEAVSRSQWAGIILIGVGSCLVGRTKPRTDGEES